MNLIFLGGICAESQKRELNKICLGPVQTAAEALQWNIIKGLEKNIGRRLMILSAYFIGAYPKQCKKIMIKGFKWNKEDHDNAYTIPFLNLKIIQHFSKYYNLIKLFKTLKKEIINGSVTIIIYSAYFPFLMFAKYIKNNYPGINICLVVPDLPEYMGLGSKNIWYHSLTALYTKRKVIELIKYVDCFVLLTEHMNEKINVFNKPYVVIEGMIGPQDSQIILKSEPEKKIILYSGTLQRKYGIIHLLEAFEHIKEDDYMLYICGEGEAKRDIINASQKDKRINYLGVLEREEVLELQRNCTILVNPRQNNEEYTKYSFPSKTMEYLQSGNPVIAYKLDGIPEEYDDYLIYAEGDSAKDLANSLERILNLSNEIRREIGIKGKNFVENEKNYINQTKKILEMFEAI